MNNERDLREILESTPHSSSAASSFSDLVWSEIRAGFLQASKTVSDAARDTALHTKHVQEFKSRNHLDVVKNGDSYEYVLKALGKDHILFKTAATEAGLKEGQRKVDDLVDDKQKDLAKRFNVQFSSPNEFVTKQNIEHKDCTVTESGDVHARLPNLHELAAVEQGFKHAAPSHLAADGKTGLKIYFLQETYYKGDAAIAYYIEKDKNGHPALYFDPGETDGMPATEKDAEREKYHVDGRLIDSVEAVIIHECAHNEQENKNLGTAAEYAKLAPEFGWVTYKDASSAATLYMQETKDGKFYKYHHDDCSQPKQWTLCNKQGETLDKDGHVTHDRNQYITISKTALRDILKVKPPTVYFNNLYEEHAEAATAFRIDSIRRGLLLADSPSIYAAVKRWDDEEIAGAYGSNPDKTPIKMRSADGDIVDNTAANRKALHDWEADIKAKHAKKK